MTGGARSAFSRLVRRIDFAWLLAAAVALLAFGFVYWRGQDKNWDLLNYHFYAGYSLLHGNYLRDIAPMGLVSFLNPAVNVPAYLALSQLAFPASAWALTLVQLLVLPLLLLIGRQLGRELGFAPGAPAEWLALALCLLAPLWWSEMGTTFADASTAPLVLLGLYLGLRGVAQGEAAGKLLVFAGLCFGLAVGLKLTNAPFALGFVGALAGVSARYRYRWRPALRLVLLLCLGMLLGFVLTAGWNAHLWLRWESPLFPLYNAWFKSPHADWVNFGEGIWRFQSFTEFFWFLWAAVTGTGKTSEIAFADARMAVLFVLALAAGALAIWRSKHAARPAPVALALLLFIVLSVLLWAKVFGYQRYLIPVELLLGFGIWVALAWLTRRRGAVALLLALCVLASAALIKVPNWGHTGSRAAQANAFGLRLPPELAATPARYLLHGNAISYLLPFLHPDSEFYGVEEMFNSILSRQADALVRAELGRQSGLPLRILFRQEAAARYLWQVLSRYQLAPGQNSLSCAHFRSQVDVYVICEVHAQPLPAPPARLALELDFQDAAQVLPPALLGLSGLSRQEAWGRWSDGDKVELVFANCLPQGVFRLDLRGHAFGPNIGKPVRLALGDSQASVVLGADDSDHRVTLENRQTCQNTLTVFVPHKVSPQALGLNADRRQLGVGLVRLGIHGPD